MAKSTAEVVTTTETLPTTTSQSASGVPDFLRDQIEVDAGKGVSTDQADNIVPLLYVLQTNSPQVNKRNAEYIEGAEPGDIWLRGAPQPIIKGQAGFLYQPCFFNKDWVEWVPRDDGGGLVGRHQDKPAGVVEEHDPESPGVVRYSMPNGNELKETRYHIGRVFTDQGLIMPYVIPLTGTGHSVSRQWMFMMNSKQTDNGKSMPSFACLYRLRTKFRKNKRGEWFTLEVVDAGYVKSAAEYNRGKELHEAMIRGEKKIEEDRFADDGGKVLDDGVM